MSSSKIHSTAIVSAQAEISSDVEVGPYCTIGPNVKLGPGNRLISHVVIDGHTTIGSGNVFYPFSVIGGLPQDLKYKGEKTELIIGNDNTVRESVTLNLGTAQGGGKTVMGNNNLLMAYTHLGHDTIMGSHCILANSAAIAGHVILEDYVTIGGLTGVTQFVHVGSHVYCGAGAMIDKDAPPYSILVGARPCEVKGTNLVGLRRRGFKNEVISAINESLKLWRETEIQKDVCLQKIEAEFGSFAEVRILLDFIRNSKNGCLR
jgi:UDP-N-acetylglucosamine acyltransferase